MTRTFALDLIERAAKTFLQAFAAVVVAQWSASGLGADIFDYSAWQKLVAAAVTAGVGAVFSLGMNVFSGLKTGTASLSHEVAQSTPDEGLHAAAPVDEIDQPTDLAGLDQINWDSPVPEDDAA